MDRPEKVVELMKRMFYINQRVEEYLFLLCFSDDPASISVFEVSHGTSKCMILGARELLARIVLSGAKSVMLVHNHPGGNATPSEEDDSATDNIKLLVSSLGIKLLDHIVVGDSFFSYREQGKL